MYDHPFSSIEIDSHNNDNGYILSSHTESNRSVVREKQQHIPNKYPFWKKINQEKRVFIKGSVRNKEEETSLTLSSEEDKWRDKTKILRIKMMMKANKMMMLVMKMTKITHNTNQMKKKNWWWRRVQWQAK